MRLVLLSVTVKRYVSLLLNARKTSTGGGDGTVVGWLIASVVGPKDALMSVTTSFPSLRHVQLPTPGVPVPEDSMRSGKAVSS